MATRIKLRRDSASNWDLQNPILALGEPGVVLGTNQIKIGDGTTHWADLPYAAAGDLTITGTAIHNDAQIDLSTGRGVSSEWVGKVLPPEGINTNNSGTTTDAVAYDSQGNAYIAGWYWSGYGSWLIKVDSTGQELYRLFFSEYDAYGWSLVVDSDDNFYMLMEEYDASNNTILVTKLSGADGGIMWTKAIADGSSNSYATCLDVDGQNNVIVAGATYNEQAFYVAKLNGNNGDKIWDKWLSDYGSSHDLYGIKVDHENNIGLVGNRYNMGAQTQIIKINGSNGDLIWEKLIGYVNLIETDSTIWEAYSGDISTDSEGNFYALYSWQRDYDGDPLMITVLAKYDTDGLHKWSKQIGEQWYDNVAGSVAVDSDGYIYVTAQLHHNTSVVNGSQQFNLITVKFDTRGNVVWQRSLQKEQNSTYTQAKPYDYPEWSTGGQLIAVNDTHVLIGGGQYENYYYSDSNQNNDVQGWAAQVSKDGREWEKDGWKFSSLDVKIKSVTSQDVTGDGLNTLDWGNANLNFSDSDVYNEPLFYTWNPLATNDPLTYSATFKNGTFTVEGNLGVNRKTIGRITQIGWFQGPFKYNSKGNVTSNGVVRDSQGNSYLAMTWYDNQYNIYNGNVPFLSKVLPDGTVAWQATTQQIDFDSDVAVGVAIDPTHNQPVLMSDDGNGGFRLTWFDIDSGNVTKVTEVTDVEDQYGNHNLYPYQLKFKADGTPVVVGYKGDNYNDIKNVTNGAAGHTGSSTGVLIIPTDKFTNGFPSETYNWHVYSDSINDASTYIDAGIYGVNHYADLPTNSYRPGAGAVFTINVTSGVYSVVGVENGGARYNVGNQLIIDGAGFPSGVTITNDATITVTEVDANGVIISATVAGTAASTDGDYAGLGSTIFTGTGATLRVQIDPDSGAYGNIQVNSGYGGSGYVIGDKLIVLGSAIASGIDGENDLIVTVSDVDSGVILGVSDITGTGNNEYIKLDVDTGFDFSVAGQYDIYHYTGTDGFIWTPDWCKVLQGENSDSNTDYLTSLDIDSEGNIIVGGKHLSGGGDNNYYTTLVAKFDTDGNKVWSKYIDNSNDEYQTVYGIVTNSDDEVFVSSNGNGNSAYLTKLDSTGDEQWQLRFDGTEGGHQGLDIDDDGSVIIGGSSYNNNYSYNYDYFLAKVSTHGNVEWQRYLRSQNNDYNSYNNDYAGVIALSGGKVAITGYTYTPGDNNYQTVLAVLPSDGTGAVEDTIDNQYELGNSVGAWRYIKAQNTVYYNIDNVDDKNITVNNLVLTTTTYVDNDAPMSVFLDRQTLTFDIKEPQGAEVQGVAKIVFEDGTTQTTTAQDIPQVDLSLTNSQYWYTVGLNDRGKHIYKQGGGIYVPTNEYAPFPIGTVITIVVPDNSSVYLSPSNWTITRIMGTGGVDNNPYGNYNIAVKSIVTLLKVEQDTWMLSGGTFTTN